MMSINEARQLRITKLRAPVWSNPHDHIELYFIENGDGFLPSLGPWVKLWSPANKVIGAPNPQQILILRFDLDKRGWEPWEAPK